MLEGLSNLTSFKGIDPKQLTAAQNPTGAVNQLIPQSDLAALPKTTPGVGVTTAPGALARPASLAGVQTGSGAFERTLNQFVGEVSAQQGIAADAVHGLINGQGASLHQTMIAIEEAHVSFQLMVEVRNKLLESYQELMRMQI